MKFPGSTSHLLEDSGLDRRRFLGFDKPTGVLGEKAELQLARGKQKRFQTQAGLRPPSLPTTSRVSQHVSSAQMKAQVWEQRRFPTHPQLSPLSACGPPQQHSPCSAAAACSGQPTHVHLAGTILQSFTQAQGLHTSNELLAPSMLDNMLTMS